MDTLLKALREVLNKQIGHHRQLLETVRQEEQALLEADLKELQEITYAKDVIIHSIHQTELERRDISEKVRLAFQLDEQDFSLSQIILEVQKRNTQEADRFRNVLSVLNLLIKRIDEQNQKNQKLVENSLHHIEQMRQNVLGDQEEESPTYSKVGQKVKTTKQTNLFSQKV